MAGATPIGNMVIKLGLDDADFGRGVQNSKKQVSYLAKEMQANMKIADASGNTMSKLGTKYDSLTKIISAQENQVKDLKKAYDDSFVDGKATDSTKRLAGQLQDANGKLASYKGQLINTAGALAEMQVKTQGYTGIINEYSQKLQGYGKSMSTVGGALTKGVTLPIAGAAIAVSKAAIGWESAFAGVKKTNDEVVDSTGKVVYSYDDLERGLRDLAKELPSSHQEIAAVAEAAGQLGIKTENVKSFTKTMIDMGESTNLSAETASTELARFANIVGMSQDKFSNLGSAIVDLGNNYATTEAEISAMALRLAGAGKQIGMSEGDILGFSAALSSVGIEAEAGGSAFSKVMVQMQLATEKGVGAFSELEELANGAGYSIGQVGEAVLTGGKPLKDMASALGTNSKSLKKMYKEADKSKTSLEQFADVAGMTGEQFAKMFKEDPSTAIMKFVEGLAKAEESGSSAIKVLDDMDIKEVRLRDSLLRAANASGIFGDAIKTGNKAFKDNTALTEEAGKRYETTESKLKMLKNEVVDAAIDLGGPFVDALRDGLDAAKPLIKGLGDLAQKFSDSDPKTQKAIVKLVAYAAAAGPVLSITGKMTSGIGKLGSSFVDLAASMAKKKAIADVTKQLADGAISAGDFGKVMASGADDVLKFGGAAGTAAGSQGVGAMVTALGSGGLAGALPLIIGAGGLLAVGYGAWKTFGEEAWNSSQRVKEWGTDVGSEVSGTLETVKGKTEEASGQFGLLASGVSTNTGEMANNFATIGTTLEDSLTKKIQGLDGLLKALPETVSDTMEQIVTDEKERNERSLATVEENNAHIKALREKASNENRELTLSEAKQIQDLSTKSAEAYVETLDVSAEQKRAILKSMTADVSSATKEEAKVMMQSLGEQYNAQQSHYAKSRKQQEEWLKEWGYNLDGEFAQKYLDEWDAMNQATGDGFLNQMALIKQKFPELENEVHMGSGKLISEATGASDLLIEDNEKLMRSIGDMANELAENTQKNADQIALTAEAGTAAGDMWNSLELIDKEGNVKTNAQEIVNEAAKEEKNWNQMMWLAKDADVSSNAKLMIAEAAIANGKWEGLSFTEQQAMLDSNVTKTMTQAVQAKGDWAGLSFDEKKALIYSNTPETMAETMANLGLWDKYQPEIKELGAKNTEFLGVIAKSEEKLGNWNSIPAETKEILGDNYDLLKKLYESDERFNLWKQIPDAQKKILGNNEDLILKITGSEATFNAWNQLPETEKKILGNNQDVLAKILSSEQEYNRWSSLPETEKHLLGNNSDLLAKVMASEGSINAWNALPANEKQMLANNTDLASKVFSSEAMWTTWNSLPPDIKQMLANNEDVMNKLLTGEIALDNYDKNNPALKRLLGDSSSAQNASNLGQDKLNAYARNNPAEKKLRGNSSSAQSAARSGEDALNRFGRNNPSMKYLKAQDNASGPARDASREVDNFSQKKDHTVTLTSIVKNVTKWISEKVGGNATGTNYHPGGPMMVNDQKGPLYRELVVRPNGESFIPYGRDVILPDEPKGTKVYTAAKTKRMVPQYAKGIGVPENSSLVQNLRALDGTERTTTNTIKVQADNSETEKKLDQLIKIMSRFGDDLANMQLIADSRVIGTVVTTHQNAEAKRKSIIKTGRVK